MYVCKCEESVTEKLLGIPFSTRIIAEKVITLSTDDPAHTPYQT
jgi:hypothetical protein